MRVPRALHRFITKRLMQIPKRREPDEVIGPGIRSRLRDGPHQHVPKAFLRRWFLVPKNRVINIYLHNFIRDDEDRALHDHPWWNLSCLLQGSYIEHTIAAGGVHKRDIYTARDLKLRPPWAAHRVELFKTWVSGVGEWITHDSWSLFITGPVQRGWGFHCPGEWRDQKTFARENGCGQQDERALREYSRRDSPQK